MILDPTISSAAAVAFESLCNTALRYDPGSRQQLKKLAGNTLCLHLKDMNVDCYLSIASDADSPINVHLLTAQTKVNSVLDENHNTKHGEQEPLFEDLAEPSLFQKEAQVTLSANSTQLIQLALEDSKNFTTAGLDISGNVHLLGDFYKIIQQLDIDWEDALAQKLGQSGGQALAVIIKTIWQRKRAFHAHNLETLGHFFRQEYSLIPQKSELQSHSRELQTLRAGTDRLEAKIKALKSRLTTDKEKQPL